ncbi:DUF7089 family protein [Halocatena halophila]|uniref:DUF7089 family protein n=1 Tax=Halocatena halophila TaxID=2814576 RepID=UPI002ED10947
MFDRRDVSQSVDAVRSSIAPGALIVDTPDFQTLETARAEELGLLVETIDPISYDPSWLPESAPAQLRTTLEEPFAIGLPGDGGVAWTSQTDPPVVFVKARLEGSPASFVEFLIAEALCEIGQSLPENCLGFFRESYLDLDAAVPLGPTDTFQLAVALFDAYRGLYTQSQFERFSDDHPALFGAWQDAGERLEPRLDDLSREVATGRTSFTDAAELACSAIKHDVAIPTPFDVLDSAAYREGGPEYGIVWAEKTFDKLTS